VPEFGGPAVEEEAGGAAEFGGAARGEAAASAEGATAGDTTARPNIKQPLASVSTLTRGIRDANTARPYSFEGPELGTAVLVAS
jgi:hypothetical protein